MLLAHGGGGRLMHELLERVFLPAFGNPSLDARHDAAVLQAGGARVAFTTDSYVVHPLFFPGGSIGTLAVNGTVNDLAMAGARPLALSAGFIIEEGLGVETLERVVASMRDAARAAGVPIVTGDTKVVDRGKGDGLFINTSGLGLVEHGLRHRAGECPARRCRHPERRHRPARHGHHGGAGEPGVRERHRERLRAGRRAGARAGVVGRGRPLPARLTRGGLASALNEIAAGARVGVTVDERKVAVREDVRGACEILGFDPMYVANEGRFVAFVPEADAARTVEVLRRHPVSGGAGVIGRVTGGPAGLVAVRTALGATRVLDMLSGEQLPRIC